MQEGIFKPQKNAKTNNIIMKPDEVGWEEQFLIIDPKKKRKEKKKTVANAVLEESIQEMGLGPNLDSKLDEY